MAIKLLRWPEGTYEFPERVRGQKRRLREEVGETLKV